MPGARYHRPLCRDIIRVSSHGYAAGGKRALPFCVTLYLFICHVQLCNHFYFEVVSVQEVASPQELQIQRDWMTGPISQPERNLIFKAPGRDSFCAK